MFVNYLNFASGKYQGKDVVKENATLEQKKTRKERLATHASYIHVHACMLHTSIHTYMYRG